jgi:hypothetical protein
VDPDLGESPTRLVLGGRSTELGAAAIPQHLLDVLRASHHRVQHRERVLEDHRDPVAAQPCGLASPQAQHVVAVQAHLAVRHADAGRQEPDHRAGRQRLAATGLSDDRDGLATIEVELHAVHERPRLGSRDVRDP